MCGIFFYRGLAPVSGRQVAHVSKYAANIKHRGPDDTRTAVYTRAVAVFHRLKIVDTSGGMQPFTAGDWMCMINGEIYNYQSLYSLIAPEYKPKSHSDCEVVFALFLTFTKEFPSPYDALCKTILAIDGEYAIVLYNIALDYVIAVTDELRTRPLFFSAVRQYYQEYTVGHDYYLVSEQKAAPGECWPLHPGTIYAIGADSYTARNNICVLTPQDHPFVGNCTNTPTRDLSRASRCILSHNGLQHCVSTCDRGDILALESPVKLWGGYVGTVTTLTIPQEPVDAAADYLRQLLVENVHAKMHSDRGYGFLLSGGIDSSLICGIAAKYCRDHSRPRIRTFTVGFSAEAPDILAARKVAAHIDSVHTEIIVPYHDGIAIIPEVIRQIESWDQTSVRASIPMSIAARWIKTHHPEIAVIYSGEVADELLRGYLYNRTEVCEVDARADMRKRLLDISMFDGLRADRVIASQGMEVRFPFFSRQLIQFVYSLPWEYLNPPSHHGVEKWFLRRAFAGTDYIPAEILLRTKNAFSDATSVQVSTPVNTHEGNTAPVTNVPVNNTAPVNTRIGSEWKEMLKAHAEANVTEDRFNHRATIYPGAPIHTREDMYYMDIFVCGYAHPNTDSAYNWQAIPYKWLPSWTTGVTDSSATVLYNV